MSTAATLDLATVEDTDFLPHVNTGFTLHCGEKGERVALSLLEVAAYPNHRVEADESRRRRRPFGLVFKCDSRRLDQGTYRLEHAELPAIELFLSPFSGGNDWCKLEAIFN